MKRTLACAIALGFFGVLTGAGCGDDPAPDGGSGGPIALDAFASEIAKLYCNRVYTCCTTAEQAQLLDDLSPPPKNEQECTTQMTLLYSFLLGEQKAAVEAGRQSYDGAKAASCIEKSKSTCAGFPESEQMQQDPECSTIFTGKVADGVLCKLDDDCSSAGSTCPSDICKPRAAEGQDCSFAECQTDLICDGTSKCAKPKADGQMCIGAVECQSGICNLNTGLCVPKTADGMPCFLSFDCQSGNCDMDVCAPKRANGAMCSEDSECQSNECDFDSSTCSAGAPACDGM